MVKKCGRLFDGRDVALSTHDLRGVACCVAGTGTKIDHSRAASESGAHPGIEHIRTPHLMLRTEPSDFLVVSTQDVIGFAVHASISLQHSQHYKAHAAFVSGRFRPPIPSALLMCRSLNAAPGVGLLDPPSTY